MGSCAGQISLTSTRAGGLRCAPNCTFASLWQCTSSTFCPMAEWSNGSGLCRQVRHVGRARRSRALGLRPPHCSCVAAQDSQTYHPMTIMTPACPPLSRTTMDDKIVFPSSRHPGPPPLGRRWRASSPLASESTAQQRGTWPEVCTSPVVRGRLDKEAHLLLPIQRHAKTAPSI